MATRAKKEYLFYLNSQATQLSQPLKPKTPTHSASSTVWIANKKQNPSHEAKNKTHAHGETRTRNIQIIFRRKE